MAKVSDRGDMTAAELFREYGTFVARFLYRLGVPAHAIDDAVQDVFLVVHQRGGYRRGPAEPTSYLAVIAVNAASAQRRKARTHASRVDATEPDALSARGGNPELSLETRHSLERLQRALDKLDPELRATLLLADAEEETCASIAQAMGIPVGTVYWRLHEARKKFQSALKVVDAASNRPRTATTSAPPPAATPVFARSSRMLSMAIGFIGPAWKGSEAQRLLQTAANELPVPFDLEAGLARHADTVAQLAAGAAHVPSLAPPTMGVAVGSGAGALKALLALAGGGAALVVSLQLWPKPNPTASQPDARAERAATEAVVGQAPVPVVEVLGATDEVPEQAVHAGASEREAHSTASAGPGASAKPHPRPFVGTTKSGTFATSSVRGAGGSRGARAALGHPDTRASSASEERAQEAARDQAAQAAAEPPRSPAPLAPASSADVQEVLEAQALGRAEKLLRSDPAQALAIVRKVAVHGRSDYLSEERRYIEVMALYALQEPSAKQAAEAFLKSYPQSIFSERVRRARAGADGG